MGAGGARFSTPVVEQPVKEEMGPSGLLECRTGSLLQNSRALPLFCVTINVVGSQLSLSVGKNLNVKICFLGSSCVSRMPCRL